MALMDPSRGPEAPDAPDFESMVEDALDSLPEAFRSRLGSVAIVIEEEPTPAQLATVRAHGLFGLYQGVPRTAYGAESSASPSKITIFRGPHLRAYGWGPRLADGVTSTVRHEVAHHFGISDARLDELQGRPPR
jgi:predicted Zn-dependent protease with MMP-like domain